MLKGSRTTRMPARRAMTAVASLEPSSMTRSEEHTSELQSRSHLVCRLLLEKKKDKPRRPGSCAIHHDPPHPVPLPAAGPVADQRLSSVARAGYADPGHPAASLIAGCCRISY